MDAIQPHSEAAMRPHAISRQGHIYSYTIITDAPESFGEQAPYILALVQTDDDRMLTVQLTDLDPREEIQIGMRVEMVLRKLQTEGSHGMIAYGYKFRPVHEG